MTEQYYPKDLIINPTAEILAANTASDKNNFTVVVPDLKIDSAYTFQFQYVFEDGVKSDWSPSKLVVIGAEPLPGAPVITAEGGAGFIKVGLATFPTNAFRVDIRISGGTFGSGTVVVDSFTSAGTKTITAAGGSGIGAPYSVSAITVSPTKTSIASTPITVYVTDPTSTLVVEPSATPSTPTVSSVVGAIQLSWNGKKADGGDQPAGFKAAKVYVGTSAGFTPIDSGNPNANQVDVLDFGNGQNTLNIGVGTVVNGVAITYDTDYYVKIKTTNGNAAEDSAAVSATGNPAQIGKVGNNGLIEITADKITTGTLQSNSTITVGATGGRRVELRGSGVPFEIFGTGGSSLLSYNASSNKLSITGEGTFSGALQAASGDFTGSLKVGSSSNPVITNITSDGTYVTVFAKTIIAVGDVISISGVRSSNAFVSVTNAVGNGTTVTYTGSNTFSIGETVTVSGITPSQYNLKGVIVNRTSSQFTISSNKTGAFISSGVAGYPHVFDLNNVTVDRITDAAGNHITASGVDVYAESFRVINSTNGSYTSGGSIVRSAFQVGTTGILKAAEGIIGGWLINGSKLVSSGTSNRIELDPLTPAITLFNSTGSNIQISASNGITHSSGSFSLTATGFLTISGVITAASGSNIAGWQTTSNSILSPTGTVSLNSSGSISLTGAGSISLTGGTFSSGTESIFAGNLTLTSGAIKSSSTLFLTGNDIVYDSYFGIAGNSYPAWATNTFYFVGSRVSYDNSNWVCLVSHTSSASILPSTGKSGSGGFYWGEEGNSYFSINNTGNVHLGSRGIGFTDLASPRNDLSFRIYQTDPGNGYFGRGYALTALDYSEFKAPSINSTGIGYKTVVVGSYGQLYNGRTFYYGSASTSSAINTEVGGQLGDVYFSTV